jgi:6-phosphogluconolactonase
MSDPGTPIFLEFETREMASKALAARLAELLEAAEKAQGKASLVVSGGTSPVMLFHCLREKPLPWQAITMVPSDERNVAANHPERNDAMIRHELLSGAAAQADLVSLIPPGEVPDHFDAVVLGMGGDGHTASLFPGSPDLGRALSSKNKLESVEVPQLGSSRVSLTPSALLNAAALFLLFFGDEKRRVFEAAMAGNDVHEYPVRFALHQDAAPVAIFWAP